MNIYNIYVLLPMAQHAWMRSWCHHHSPFSLLPIVQWKGYKSYGYGFWNNKSDFCHYLGIFMPNTEH